MSAQVAAAKATWEGVKVVVFAVALLALVGWGYWQWQRGNERDRRLGELEGFKQSVEDRERVSGAADTAFDTAQDAIDREHKYHAAQQAAQQANQREAADEDPDARAWLDGRIPERLREADAAARRAGRLGEGARPRRAAD